VWLDPDDRIRYATVLAQVLPAPAFKGLAERIRAKFTPEDFVPLATAVPAMAG